MFSRVAILGLLFSAIQVGANGGVSMVYDLAQSWSDTQNPNGVWSYRGGDVLLRSVLNWEAGRGFDGQPAWAPSPETGNFLPAWFRSTNLPVFPVDWQPGDVVVHTADPTNSRSEVPANLVWTSPGSGVLTIDGGVWMGRDLLGRGNRWTLYVDDHLITAGSVFAGDIYSRSRPFDFREGFGGTNAVTDLRVAAGTRVRLEIVRESPLGEFVGVRMSMRLRLDEPVLGIVAIPGIEVYGTPGKRYRIEYTDRVGSSGEWHFLREIQIATSPELVLDLGGKFATRFYRAVEIVE